MTDMENYLNQNYSKVEKLSGGGYYCTDSKGNNLYVPANCSTNMSMLAYLPGAGGSGNDARVLRNIIRSNNPPEYIVSISYTAYRDNAQNLLTRTYNSLSSQGIGINNVVQMSFSASGGVGFTSLNKLLSEHPDVHAAMVVNNTEQDTTQVYNPKRYQALIQGEVPIIYVDPRRKALRMNRMKDGLKNGFNMFYLESTSGAHIYYNSDILYNRFVDYLFGYRDSFGNKSEHGGKDVNYRLFTYDKDGNEVPVDAETIVQKLSSVKIPDLDKLKNPNAFEIKTKVSPVKGKYENALTSLQDTPIVSKDGTAVSSEYTFVSDTMNQLKQQIKSSSFIGGYNSFGFRASSGIPGCIVGYLNAYFDVVGCLLNDMAMEADAVISYGQAMVDMDADLKKGAENVGTIYETDQNSRYIAVGLPKEVEEESTKPAEQTEQNDSGTQTRQDTGDNSYDDSDYSTGGGSSVGGGGTGGGSYSSPEETPTETATPTPTPTEEREPLHIREEQPTASPTPQPEQTPVEQGPPSYEPSEATPQEQPVSTPTEEMEELFDEDDLLEEENLDFEELEPEEFEMEPEEIPSISQVPVSSEPITTKRKNNSVLPVIAGLGVAAAAGIGTKAYIDHRKNNTNGEEESDDSGDDYYEDDVIIDSPSWEEHSSIPTNEEVERGTF